MPTLPVHIAVSSHGPAQLSHLNVTCPRSFSALPTPTPVHLRSTASPQPHTRHAVRLHNRRRRPELKGTKSGGIEKKKKKKRAPPTDPTPKRTTTDLEKRTANAEDAPSESPDTAAQSHAPAQPQAEAHGSGRKKTDAEKRHDEYRRKRLEERMQREGVRTHKEKVEELNRYLSGLSEHHDMPKIGPG